MLEGWLTHLNESEPALYDVPWFAGRYRHTCSARGDRSTALDLKERYVTIADALRFLNEQLQSVRPQVRWGVGGPGFEDPEAYAIVFKEGKCRWCGDTARSHEGRVVATADRPPMTGRVAR